MLGYLAIESDRWDRLDIEPVDARRALSALYRSGDRPVVTIVFLGLCVLATLAVTFIPRLYELVGGEAPRHHAWQPITAVFVHGWRGFPGVVHLALNAFLMLECGRPCERLLGSPRFLALSLASLAVNAVVLAGTDGTNGSSLVIWAWGPPLLVALAWAGRENPAATQADVYARIRGVLLLMYVVVTLVMALVPYAFGWRGNPLVSLVRANVFHLVAAGVGAAAALVLRGHIRRRLRRLGTEMSGASRDA